jgi:dTDP-4-amino-4,6-dideoxygalactose transaminase
MLSDNQREIPILDPGPGHIPLFMPHVPRLAKQYVNETLDSRWIGQGPKVDKFERNFSEKFCDNLPGISVGSGTDALHLAYLLAGVQAGDEVITPVFTCTATNIPLLYIGATPIFADIEPNSLNIDPNHIRQLITPKTKAIVCVHYGGLPCNMQEIGQIGKEFNIPIIEDAAHAVGAMYGETPIGAYSDFTMFSFQAIKHITTGDGGYLSIKDPELLEKAKRLRWFGIDRTKKQLGVWENDITDVGYKYQLTDIGAAMGLAALEEFDETMLLRKQLFNRYVEGLKDLSNLTILSEPNSHSKHAYWLFTVAVDNRRELQIALMKSGIESNQVHYRNDRYSIFGERRSNLPVMDALENKYLVLPLHTKMSVSDVDRIVKVIREVVER